MSTTLTPSAAASGLEINPVAGASPRLLARTAGVLYLINIVLGAFAIGFVPAMLIVPDPATTAHNIQTHELLYRTGLAAHVVVTLTNIPLAMIFYEPFKVVSNVVLLPMLIAGLASTTRGAGHIWL